VTTKPERDRSQPTPPLLRLLRDTDPRAIENTLLFIRVSLAVVIGFILWHDVLALLGVGANYFEPTRMERLRTLELYIVLGWCLLYGGTTWCKRHRTEPRAVIHLVVQYFSLTFVGLGYGIGHLSLPSGVFLVGAPLLAFS